MDIPWDKIDKEMHEVVRVLNDNEIITTACCVGHGKQYPWVNCRITTDYGEEDIINTLIEYGYCGFTISKTRYVNSRKSPIKSGPKHYFWNIQFWGMRCLQPKDLCDEI